MIINRKDKESVVNTFCE
jgi:hypothetical protein